MSRDRDIRNAAATALLATGAFDAVYIWHVEEAADRGSAEARVALLEPEGWREADEWDAVSDGTIQIDGTFRLTLVSRDEDPQRRDESVELLLDVACNTVNGKSLASLTLPAWTKVTRATWKSPCPPERRIVATIAYRYLVDTFVSFDTNE